MSAGSRIVQMRTLIRKLAPYLDHRSDCMIRGRIQHCTCDYATVVREVQYQAKADPANTGFYGARKPQTLPMGKL